MTWALVVWGMAGWWLAAAALWKVGDLMVEVAEMDNRRSVAGKSDDDDNNGGGRHG